MSTCVSKTSRGHEALMPSVDLEESKGSSAIDRGPRAAAHALLERRGRMPRRLVLAERCSEGG